MGDVIYLTDRRRCQPPPRETAAAGDAIFFFDVSDPLSYLMAERIERRLGPAEWVPVDGARLRGLVGGSADGDESPGETDGPLSGYRARVEARARALRLPLVWPDRFPGAAPCAQRACAFACEIGAGPAFALAASRLAFCGGFDLEDPETLAEAAAAAGMPLEECLAAAGEAWRDEELEATAAELCAHGITTVPAVRLGDRWLSGGGAVLAGGGMLAGDAPFGAADSAVRVLAPVS